ncbi:MAG: ATP-binding protein [Saprospiraceae bacterium]|nr:ATP-binding protein [Saprospiraceae bacterium]
MKIKDIRLFRQWLTRNARMNDRDPNFIGYSHPYGSDSADPDEKRGLFNVFHSSAPIIENRIATVLDMAQDSQAIYEFVQNAVDCNSTHFYMFYSDNYFVVINNGDVFSLKGIKAILNFAQTTKTEEKEENIGKFGIGFKLIHRMVGEGNSIKELVNDNTGPLLFSWSNRQQLEQMINAKSVDALELSQNTKNWDALDSAWFFKIMLTCAPVLPFSKDFPLRDAHYDACDSNDNSLFSDKEFGEFTDYLSHIWKRHKDKFDTANLNQGTLFFLKLGKDKESKLNEDYSYFSRGIHYALHFVGMLMNKKGLGTIYVNDHEPIIRENIDLTIEETFVIPKDSAAFHAIGDKLKGHDRRNDIKLMLGYQPYERNNPKYGELQNTPNFFKFFPMGKEVNQLNFVIHCNVFAIDASRREFVDKHPVNEYVLSWLAKEWIKRLETYKNKDTKRFMNMYLAILTSEDPSEQSPHAQWLSQALYQPLLKYIRNNIPTQNKKVPYGNTSTVRIKDTELDIQPADFGVNTHHWIYWDLEDLDVLQHFSEKEHPNKIGLTAWGVDYLIASSTELHKINEWLSNANPQEFSQFLKELDSHLNKKAAKHALFKQHLKQIKLFRVGDAFYSSQQINQSDDFLVLPDYLDRPEVKKLLGKIGFKFSEIDFGSYDTLKKNFLDEISYLKNNKNIDLFFRILKKANMSPALKTINKLNLFRILERIINVSLSPQVELLWNIPFFRNKKGEYKELNRLLAPNRQTPKWLSDFEIKKEDYSDVLVPYMIKPEQVYRTLLYPFWDKICNNFLKTSQSGASFYKHVVEYYSRKDSLNGIGMLSANRVYLLSHYVKKQNTTFRDRSSFYHHSNLSKVSHYNALANALYKISKVFVPLRGTLQYLKHNPFNTISNTRTIFESLSRINKGLELQEISVLLHYIIKLEKYDFFNLGYVEQNPDDGLFMLCIHDTKRNCNIDPKSKLSAYVSQYLSNEYALLPHGLQTYKKEESVRSEREVLDKVLQISKHAKIDDKETLLEIIRLQGDQKALKRFIFDLNKITVNLDQPIDKNTFEVIILLLSYQHFKNDQNMRISIQEKIYFQYNKRFYKLSDLRRSKSITLSLKTIQVTLAIDQLLPHKAKSEQDLAYEALIQQMNTVGLSYQKLNDLFELEKTITVQEIAHELQENYMYKEKPLDTAEQLVFLVSYAQSNANELGGEYIGNYYIDTLAGKQLFEPGTYYYQHYQFIKPGRLLNKKYKNCSTLLGAFYQHPTLDYVLVKSPYIKDKQLYSDGIVSTYQFRTQHRKTFLDFLIQLWKTHSKHFSEIDWNNIEGSSIGTYLGFDPLQRIIAPNKYLIRSENCTPMLEEWLGTNKNQSEEIYKNKKNFLQVLGFHNEDSAIIRLRKYLSGEIDGIVQFNEGQLQQFLDKNEKYSILLINTIRWIEQKNISINSSDFYIIKLLYKYVEPEEAFSKNSVPLLCITESVNDVTKAELTTYQKNRHHNFYWYDSAQQRIYLEDHKISLDKLINWTLNNNISLINLNDYPTKWKEMLSVSINKLSLEEQKPLFSNLIKRAQEWTPPYLELWQKIADAKIRIYKYRGQIPYSIAINGQRVWTIHKGDSYLYPFHDQGSSYFINTQIDFDSALRDILASNLYIKLLEAQSLFKKESILDAAVNLNLFIKNDDAYEAIDWDWEKEKTGIIQGQVSKNGQPISIILKNTVAGELKLSTEELAILLQNKNELFVYDGKNIVRKKLSIIDS